MIRAPVVAGRFYPGTASSLRSDISRMVDLSTPKEKAIGVISPHAGYPYSGYVAGATLSRIELQDTCVIIGPNHTGYGKPFSIMTHGYWETPLGKVEIDSELGEEILRRSEYLEEDSIAHEYEHSVEVQIPFLQYLKGTIKIVPMVLGHSSGSVYKEIGYSIAQSIEHLGKGSVLIASSDMTHYEPQDIARKKDSIAIEAILALDEDALLERIASYNITMCGYAPTISVISAAKILGATRAELIKYQTSGDVTGDFSRVVGYAGVIIK